MLIGMGNYKIWFEVGGLSDSELQSLRDLLKQQADLQAAADLQNAQTLAQQIAEIEAAKRITAQDAIDAVAFKAVSLARSLEIVNSELGDLNLIIRNWGDPAVSRNNRGKI